MEEVKKNCLQKSKIEPRGVAIEGMGVPTPPVFSLLTRLLKINSIALLIELQNSPLCWQIELEQSLCQQIGVLHPTNNFL